MSSTRTLLMRKRGQVQFVRSTLRAVPANWSCPLFRALLPALLAVVLIFAFHAKAQAVVLVEYDFDQGDIGVGGTVLDISGNGVDGILFGNATVSGGKLNLHGTADDYLDMNSLIDVFGSSPLTGVDSFTIELDLTTSTSGFFFASDNSFLCCDFEIGKSFSFYVDPGSGDLVVDNWWIGASGTGGAVNLLDNVEHSIKIEYNFIDDDTNEMIFTIDGAVFQNPPDIEAPSVVEHDTDYDDVTLGRNLNWDIGAEFGFLTGTIDNFILTRTIWPPASPGHFFWNEFAGEDPGLLFDTDLDEILVASNGTLLDANDLSFVFTPIHFGPDGEPILGPGTYSGIDSGGVTTYTFGPLDAGEWLTFHRSIGTVSVSGTNSIAMVVPGDMWVGKTLGFSVNLDLGTTDSTGTPTDGILRISNDATLSVSNVVDVYQLQLLGGVLNNAGSMTSSNTSTTDGAFAYELEGGTVNLVLGGTGAALRVTGDVELTQTNTYTGVTRISAGGLLKTTNPTGIDAASAGLQFAGGSLVVSTATLNVTLGAGAGEANFVETDGFQEGGGWVAEGSDLTLTLNNGAGSLLKYGTGNFLSAGTESGALRLNNSGLATAALNLTNDIDLNATTSAGGERGNRRPIAGGDAVELSGRIMNSGAHTAELVLIDGSFLLSGNSNVVDGNEFTGTFHIDASAVAFGASDYFVPNAVDWIATDFAIDLGGTQTAANVVLGSGEIVNGTMNLSGDVELSGVVSEADFAGSGTMHIQGANTLFGDNALTGEVFLGGVSTFGLDPFGADVAVGSDTALGQAGTTVTVDPASDGLGLEFIVRAAEGSNPNLVVDFAMGNEQLTLIGGSVLTISGTISGNKIIELGELAPNVIVDGDRFDRNPDTGVILGVEGDIRHSRSKVALRAVNTFVGPIEVVGAGELAWDGSSTSLTTVIRVSDLGALSGVGVVPSSGVLIGPTGTLRPSFTNSSQMTLGSVEWNLAGTGGTLSFESREERLAIGNYTITIPTTSTGSPTTLVAGGVHIGRGSFVRTDAGAPIVESPTSLVGKFFQAADGDTNGDKFVNTDDITNILSAAVFETGKAADWTTGDFTGDGLVTTDDITEILGGIYCLNVFPPICHPFFETGQYAANPTPEGTPADGTMDLIVQPDGTATLDTNGVAISGFVIESLGGNLQVITQGTFNQASPGIPFAGFTVNTDVKKSGQFFNTTLWPGGITGIINLGQLFATGDDALVSDLDIDYTLQEGGNPDADCIGCVDDLGEPVIPEPSSLALAVLALLGLVTLRGRHRTNL